MTRDQEIWAMALWVDWAHGDQAHAYIDTMMKYLADDPDELAKWREARARLSLLRAGPLPVDGQTGGMEACECVWCGVPRTAARVCFRKGSTRIF
ncbi:hypothetical protein GRI62_09855 [Erythrobacter arachoides]|uniref:Uncharacterized protein n=1 Tax=Aurantiacibacter arachoides TaxID=1850444 RepID=A0A845A446_9SPHN|nr:hypothetical protein [Aurantiacibacter arachoides]MXO93906.1 hypothetical protein [Aurantiacibacter arachoides]GGD45708.1 hypothetical protein GCM10011411_01660 [Aurantiacibacter arachoides]